VSCRYTDERRGNFDISLPKRLARPNKLIVSALYLGGFALALPLWMRTSA
jgi:hypothetical protein